MLGQSAWMAALAALTLAIVTALFLTSLHSIFSPENVNFTNLLLCICVGKPVQMKMAGVGGILKVLIGEGSHH